MNKNQLKYFVAAAETLSFTKAADQFLISQTAITQQIKTLEDTLECNLFDRSSRPIKLTSAGQAFLIEAKAIIERMDRAAEKVREASTGLNGSIRVGYVRGYERSDMSSFMRKFHIHNTNILIAYYRGCTDMLAASLLNNETDLIVTWDSTNLKMNSEIEYISIEKAPLSAVMYSKHPFAHRSELSRSELKSESLVFASQSSENDSFGDSHFMNLYKESGYKPNIVARCSDFESALMMVATEEGISILPSYCIEKLGDADNIVIVPLVGENEHQEIIAAWRKDNVNPALGVLLDDLRKCEGIGWKH